MTSNEKILKSQEELKEMIQNIPHTIKDAMDFVSTIGERYLWVDPLCLMQDDEYDMSEGIRAMDLIYRGSALTIIAANGSNADAGLPGVHPGSRCANRVIEEVVLGVKMMVLRPLNHYMRVSHYSTRGWTYVCIAGPHRNSLTFEGPKSSFCRIDV